MSALDFPGINWDPDLFTAIGKQNAVKEKTKKIEGQIVETRTKLAEWRAQLAIL